VTRSPDSDEVAAAMKRHDRDAKGYLTREEFHLCAEEICPCVCLLPMLAANPL
jgi:hypothetical protein